MNEDDDDDGDDDVDDAANVHNDEKRLKESEEYWQGSLTISFSQNAAKGLFPCILPLPPFLPRKLGKLVACRAMG